MSYPAKAEDANLRTISDMMLAFDVPVGLSDHTIGIGVAVASIAFGVCIIEKHLTFDRKDGGVDSAFSMEPEEFQLLTEESLKAWQALGGISYGPLPSEKTSYSHRPSLYFVEDIAAGTVVQREHMSSLRPNKGLPPKDIERLVGKQLKSAVKRGTPVSWEVF